MVTALGGGRGFRLPLASPDEDHPTRVSAGSGPRSHSRGHGGSVRTRGGSRPHSWLGLIFYAPKARGKQEIRLSQVTRLEGSRRSGPPLREKRRA